MTQMKNFIPSTKNWFVLFPCCCILFSYLVLFTGKKKKRQKKGSYFLYCFEVDGC